MILENDKTKLIIKNQHIKQIYIDDKNIFISTNKKEKIKFEYDNYLDILHILDEFESKSMKEGTVVLGEDKKALLFYYKKDIDYVEFVKADNSYYIYFSTGFDLPVRVSSKIMNQVVY